MLKNINCASATVGAGGLASDATTLNVSTGEGTPFHGTGTCRVCVWKQAYATPAAAGAANREYMTLTLAASGDSFTVARDVEEPGTQQAFVEGDLIAAVRTAGKDDELEAELVRLGQLVDLSSATEDYALSVGETAIINFTDDTSVPLHIATSEGIYELKLSHHPFPGTIQATNCDLQPNNTTYANEVTQLYIYHAVENLTLTGQTSTLSAFRLIGLGVGVVEVLITTHTTNKHLEYRRYQKDAFSYSSQVFGWQHWNDTDTAWTSLGTIIQQSCSGTILVKRLA